MATSAFARASRTTGSLDIGSTLVGQYRIENLLGSGGMGRVYLATHQHLGRPVAVKELWPGDGGQITDLARRQLQHEAQLLQGLRHPRLPAVYDYIESDDGLFLVMEYVHGLSLGDILHTGVTLPEVQVRRWGLALCEVLEYLHRRTPTVIFRDLKPSNIMVDSKGELRLIDFGIAKIVDRKSVTVTFARGVGTAGYSSPEQYHGTTDARSDIYSLGATLYALLTGTRPPSSVELAAGVRQLQLLRSLRPDVSEAFAELIHRCLRLAAWERPHTVAEVARALARNTAGPASVAPLADRTACDVSNDDTVPLYRLPLAAPVPEQPLLARVQRRSWPALLMVLAVLICDRWCLGARQPAIQQAAPQRPAATIVAFTGEGSAAGHPVVQSVAKHLAESDMAFAADGSAAHYQAVRDAIRALKGYTVRCAVEGSWGHAVYQYRYMPGGEVQATMEQGSERGVVYLRDDVTSCCVLLKRGGSVLWQEVSDVTVHSHIHFTSVLDEALHAVRHTRVHLAGKVRVQGRPCIELAFSNGVIWDVDPSTSQLVRFKRPGETFVFSNQEGVEL